MADKNKLTFFDRKGLFCKSYNISDSLVFFFNNNKAFKIENHILGNDRLLHDEFFSIKDHKNLGNTVLYSNEKLFWDKNPWSNFYQFSFDLNNNELQQRYVFKKSKISNLLANLFGGAELYLKKKKYNCILLRDWSELERRFK